MWLNTVLAEEYISVSVVFLVNGLLAFPSFPSTGNTNIIASVSPRGNQGFSLHGSHVISEWAGFVSSWALGLPRKAPSVLFLPRCYRAVGGGIRVKINKIKKERNSSSKPWGLMESEGSLLWMKIHLHLCQCQDLPLWHLTNRGSQGAINSATVLIPVDLLKLFRDRLMTGFVFPSTLWAPIYPLINLAKC